LHNHEKITNKNAIEPIKLSSAQVRRIFKVPQKIGLIEAHGENRYRYYTIKKD
jgi:hypothetical protein